MRFDEQVLQKMEQLTLVANRVRVGVMKGERRSRKRGASIEFADYRDYTRGDDLRRLDWNIYARLERPFIKLLEEEEDLAVHILVDASASMDWPPEKAVTNKFDYSLRLAGALGYIGLGAGDLVSVITSAGNENRIWGPFRGRANAIHLFKFLESAGAGGQIDLIHLLRDYALRGRRPGLLFLITDLFSPAGYREGIQALGSRGYEIGLIQLLSPDETEPAYGGDVKLVDVETQADAEITLDAATIHMYRDRLLAWQSSIASFCNEHGVHYIPVTTDLPWDDLIMRSLRVRGLLK